MSWSGIWLIALRPDETAEEAIERTTAAWIESDDDGGMTIVGNEDQEERTPDADTDAWMERVSARSPQRYEDLVRSYEAARAFYKTPEYKPSTPTPGSEDEPRRQVDEAAMKRAATLRSRRLDLMKAGY